MPNPNQEASQVADALNRLSVAMEQMQAKYDAAQQAARRGRLALLAVLILVCAAAYHALSPVAEVISQLPQLTEKLRPRAVDAETAAAKRKELLAMLSPKDRAELERFEEERKWLSDYLASDPDFDPGATVALFLFQMAQSVKVMPAMYKEVAAMSSAVDSMNHEVGSMNVKVDALPVLANDVHHMGIKMNSLPVLANEVQGMNVKMSVMAAGMDSTMGRTGRMMPWSW